MLIPVRVDSSDDECSNQGAKKGTPKSLHRKIVTDLFQIIPTSSLVIS